MPNMSYCRFENTYKDLLDCFRALRDLDELNDLSDSEKRYAERLINLCEEIFSENQDKLEDEDNYGFESSRG
jgi:hypothetical protein